MNVISKLPWLLPEHPGSECDHMDVARAAQHPQNKYVLAQVDYMDAEAKVCTGLLVLPLPPPLDTVQTADL